MRMIAFWGNPLDRAGDRRSDRAFIAALRADQRTKVLPLWRLQPLLAGPEDGASPVELCFVGAAIASALGGSDSAEVFLGLGGKTAYFARDVSGLADVSEIGALGHFREARAAAAALPPAEVAILGQAKALLDWHARHRFCSRCGVATAIADAGYRRICPACKAEHFPRTDPAVIMLVTAGDECLLARNKRFAAGHYSTLAGFIEPGEAIEEAVAREVFE
jgi:NAD+ diphosphatase